MNNPDSRVGDAERNQAIDELSRYLTQGALDSYEYDLRTSEAAAAQTRADIDRLFADLPAIDSGSDDESTFNPTEAEVADMKARRKKVKMVDYPAWAATILAVIGFFVFHVPYIWVIPIICMVCSAGARQVYDLSYAEEEYLMFERRFEKRRRRAANKRRRELGQ